MKRELILIFGRVGTGKTTIARKHALRISKARKLPIIYFDLNHEHSAAGIARSAYEVESHLVDGSESIAYRPSGDGEDVFQEFNTVFRIAWEYGDVVLLVDEAELFVSGRDFNTRKSYFLRCVQFGRHRNINLVLCARTVVELNIMIRAQATKIVTFSHIEPNSLDRIEKLGFQRSQVRALASHEFLEISL